MSSAVKPIDKTFAAGKWMPRDRETLVAWMKKIMARAEKDTGPLLPVVENLKNFIENDAKAYMFFNQMFDEVPANKSKALPDLPQVRDYQHMLRLFNVILTHAPSFDETGFVGFPFNAILNWSMATSGGWAGFIDDKVNVHIKAILDAWGTFLRSPESTYVLNDDPKNGWFGEDAKKMLPNFADEFVCDPSKPHYGFRSWDDFFVREFREGIRPVAEPDNDAVVVNACESAPFAIARNVQLLDRFWIKAQPYALRFMLNDDPWARRFVGGTVYQAFLSALTYHRWHAPVSGRVVKTCVIPGTYYSETRSVGYDPLAPNDSQGYISEIATRAVIYIEADNPDIGLMCFVAIGMAEVSTCEITVYEGQHIKKGQETGMFHFGGSTHCLIFGPHVDIEFDLNGQTPGLESSNININARIATVKPRKK
ncbi:phosphatidylserine decarboxylase family protein [uncultured Victivallis sp.]|uniref:phosphatidylserine decarboxylase family protein n=1 Tax=uncultured Victivallis sp. TaxID=354118 RepID=UPI0025D2BEEF|nr:phosphatidylserine decarboxylase family protein [uncultured Victivallis sp.]